MIIDLYYSTIGLLLDIVLITLPVLVHFKCTIKTRVKFYATLMLSTYIFLALNLGDVLQYLLIFGALILIIYTIAKIDYKKLFLYVFYFACLTLLDYIAISIFSGISLVIFSTFYKVLFIAVNRIYIRVNCELKEKILSGACVSVIIIVSIIIGGIKNGY